MRRSSSVHDRFGQPQSGQNHRRFIQSTLTRRKPWFTSVSQIGRRPLERATTPQSGQPTTVARDSMVMVTRSPSTVTSMMSTWSSPTRSSHMRIGSEATGALQSSGVRNLQTGRALVSSPGSKTPLISEEPLSRAAVCINQHDEWTASDRRYLFEGSMALLAVKDTTAALIRKQSALVARSDTR